MAATQKVQFPPEVMDRIRASAAAAPPLTPDAQAVIRAAANHVHRQRREAAAREARKTA